MEILDDGSVRGRTFSGKNYKGEHPRPEDGETYEEYKNRVLKYKEQGFNLGDLSWGDWHCYCIGFGYDEIHSKNDIIE